MGLRGCSETSETTNQRCVTSQKSEPPIYTAAEARNHDFLKFINIYGQIQENQEKVHLLL
jgi:hypothetical protein